MSDRERLSWREAGVVSSQLNGFLPLFLASFILLALALLAAHFDPALPAEARIALGFGVFLVLPGLFLALIFFPHKRFWLPERLPLSIALSLGVWAFPGLMAFIWEWSLHKVIMIEITVTLGLFLVALVQHLFFVTHFDPDPHEPASRWSYAAVLAVTLGLAAFAYWTGAERGEVMDWDYFNYISAVVKLVAWNQASNAHVFYLDAPPDPIHSYNIWALQWALMARLYHLDPIELYRRSAFLTVPAAALAFFALGRRMFSANVARTAFFIYVLYNVIYAGLIFFGRTTFYPDDGMWLIVFPMCLVLFLRMFETRHDGLLLGLTLSALAASIVHVLWGLSFYLVIGSYFILFLLYRFGAARAVVMTARGGKAPHLITALALASLPVVLAMIDMAVMAARGSYDGFTPLLGGGLDFSAGVYLAAFVALPALYLIWLVAPFRPRPGPEGDPNINFTLRRTGYILAMCLFVAIPYAFLRYGAIQSTNWSQFGRNPYRAFLTANLFFLNPFELSLGNPGMTFYPLWIAGYLCLPALFAAARRQYQPRVALVALIAVPLICFHPALATFFAEHFSLGYLRRLEKLGALFCVFPLALTLHRVGNWILDEERRPLAHLALVLAAAALLSAACIPWRVQERYYNGMLKKTIAIARAYPQDSLIHDDTPYLAIREHGWFGADAVIFSDIWTSYRLTAYLPLFVACQAKPGTGVPDQDERRLLELEFFDPATGIARMERILTRFHAAGVIVNRNPTYKLYGIPCGHPEAIGKLKTAPESFEPLYDQGDWAIFRFKG
ncbi:MAG TPA: hypothetical protein VM658_13750 [bacterium]|nr:hypothetical protein [bacterium]